MIRLKESMAYAKENGKKFKKKELAMKIWGEGNPRSAYMNLLNLEKGKTKKIDVSAIGKLCGYLGVSADYLFGRSPVPNVDEGKTGIKESINGSADIIQILAEII